MALILLFFVAMIAIITVDDFDWHWLLWLTEGPAGIEDDDSDPEDFGSRLDTNVFGKLTCKSLEMF